MQDGLHLGQEILHFGLAMLTAHIIVVHAGFHGPRPVEGHQGDDVLKDRGLEAHHQGPHAVAFQLEDPGGVGGLEQLEDGGIVQGNGVDVEVGLMALSDQPHRLVDDRQGAQAQEVELHQAHLLHPLHVELGDQLALVALVKRQVLDQGPVGDDHRRGVGGGVPGQPFQDRGDGQNLFDRGVAVPQLPEARLHLQGLLQGDVQFLRHQLGDLVHFRVRHFQGPAHVADHLAGLHAAEGGDLGHVLPAVGLGDVIDDFAPALVTEVHVDIRRAHPLRIEEALEEEAVGQGVQLGDPQGIGHQAAGGGAPARTHGDPVPLGIIDDIGHHQEIAGKAHLHQDADLVFQALPVGLRRRPGMEAGGRQAGREPLPGHARP